MLGKTWPENHLGLMHRGTSGAQGGKLAKKPNINLRLVPNHLEFTAPAKLDNLGWGRGGLQGEGAPAVPGWEREKGACSLALRAGACRSCASLEAGNSWRCLPWLSGWVLTVIMVSSRVHARRGSVGFKSKARKGRWFT